jgi:precorrin isomerase
VLDGSGRLEGYAADNILASYVHLHFASHQALAPRFVEVCSRPAPTPGLLLQRHGLPPAEIEALSRARIESRVADRLPLAEPVRGLVARLVYAAGDPDLAESVYLVGEPIEAAVAALSVGARLIVDVGMVAAGISPSSLSALGVEMDVAIQTRGVAALASRHGITRSAAGMLALADRLDGALVAIGNAPTALLALLDLLSERKIRPAAVIGMPVGFVAAEESKELLLLSELPCIVVRGTRGGSALAAAAVNYLVRLAQGTERGNAQVDGSAADRRPATPTTSPS